METFIQAAPEVDEGSDDVSAPTMASNIDRPAGLDLKAYGRVRPESAPARP